MQPKLACVAIPLGLLLMTPPRAAREGFGGITLKKMLPKASRPPRHNPDPYDSLVRFLCLFQAFQPIL
jgi:hypothetical protein